MRRDDPYLPGRPEDNLACSTADSPNGAVENGNQGNLIKSPFVLAAFAVVFLLCYASVLKTSYGFLDDYAYLAAALRNKLLLGPAISGGRPIHALLIDIFFSNLRGISDLRYLRLFGILGMAPLAWGLCRTMVRRGWNAYPSMFLSVIILTLPAFQVYAAWAINSFYVYAAVASGSAYFLAESALQERSPRRRWSLLVGASLLVTAALTIQQSTGMFFWVFAAIRLFEPGTALPVLWRRFLSYCGVVFAGLLSGFIVYKLGIAVYGSVYLGPGRANLTSDKWMKVVWFVREPLVNALNIAKLVPTEGLAWTVALLLVGGLGLYFRGGFIERVWKILIAFALLPISYLPNLIVAENWPSYRTQSALTSLIGVYSFFAIWGFVRAIFRPTLAKALFSTGFGLLALASGLTAAHNVETYFAIPQLRELNLIRDRFEHADFSHLHRVYIIQCTWQYSITRHIRYDEFGLPSSAASWTPEAMAYLLLREMGPGFASLPIQAGAPDAPATGSPPDALLVDMRTLLRPQ